MTTEIVLLLAVYAFVLLGAFVGDGGLISTFKDSAPRLAGKIERQISIGHDFYGEDGSRVPSWEDDGQRR